MRESNFSFPHQNRACLLITSKKYERRGELLFSRSFFGCHRSSFDHLCPHQRRPPKRFQRTATTTICTSALDTTSPLPLTNSLMHLVYLTLTSPRVRETLTCDGGLERLVHLLCDFCLSPPPPENPAYIFGLSPPSIPRPTPIPTVNPTSFDRHAAFRFSLAFQSVVNIGVRGSELIRSRVVQAGTLDVVGCVLESWLLSKGYAVGPSSSASGMSRETGEHRHQRRDAEAETGQRVPDLELSMLLGMLGQTAHPDAMIEVSVVTFPLSVGRYALSDLLPIYLCIQHSSCNLKSNSLSLILLGRKWRRK